MTDLKRQARKVGVMIGSISDLPQCKEGLEYLAAAEADGKIEFMGLFVNSIHRNTIATLKNLYEQTEVIGVEAWLIGAGMANHLTGTCDAYLRYEIKSTIPVFGAIFETTSEVEKNRQAAILSITQVPGNQIIFDPEKPTFLDGCRALVEMANVVINPAKAKPTEVFHSIAEVLSKIATI